MVAIVSDDSVVGFTDVTYSVSENAPGGRVLIHISREGDTSRPASVTFSASAGTALAGQDFIAITTNVVLPVGESSASVTVQVINDTLVEDPESVVLRLSSPGPNTGIGQAAASLTILDDDVAPGILDVAPITPVSEGSRSVVATVTRRSGKTGFVSVQYSLRNGSASAGADYAQSSGTIFFLDGEILKSVTLSIIDDDIIEGNETFFFDISSPSTGALLGVTSAVATILDDDLPSGSVDTSFNPGAGPNGPNHSCRRFQHGAERPVESRRPPERQRNARLQFCPAAWVQRRALGRSSPAGWKNCARWNVRLGQRRRPKPYRADPFRRNVGFAVQPRRRNRQQHFKRRDAG
jgi:hypothetical protein